MHDSKRWRLATGILASVMAGLLWAAGARAAALVADLEGDVRISVGGAKRQAIAPGQRVESGSVVSTAAGARVVLRFDDGQWAALHEKSALRIEDFHFRPEVPSADRAVFVLLRGALRMVTGILGHRNPDAFTLRTQHMLIGVRGTDFLVASQNADFVSVLEGTIVASNAGGSATFSAGDFGAAVNQATPAAAVQVRALPGSVSSAFARLEALRVGEPAAPHARDKRGPATDAPTPGPHPGAFGQGAGAGAGESRQNLGTNAGNGAASGMRERARDMAAKPRPK
jgi:FecR protein